MDVAIVKTKEGQVAFSLFPVGVVGWANSEKDALKEIENNLYDYCNWLLCKLPKDEMPIVKERYSGEIENLSFKADDKKLFKKSEEVFISLSQIHNIGDDVVLIAINNHRNINFVKNKQNSGDYNNYNKPKMVEKYKKNNS